MTEGSKLTELIKFAVLYAFNINREWGRQHVTDDEVIITTEQSPYVCQTASNPRVEVEFPDDSDDPKIVLNVTAYGRSVPVNVTEKAWGFMIYCGIYGCGYGIPVSKREFEANYPDDPCPRCGCHQWPMNMGFTGNDPRNVKEFAAKHDRQGNPLQVTS